MIRNIYRITVGFVLLLPASAMHGTAREYATELTNLPRLATAKSVNFIASLMDMGAGALILIGVAPFFFSGFRKSISPASGPGIELLALNPPESPESL